MENARDLPPELLYQILPRLPFKALMRFKCVRKQWQSMIQEQSLAHDFLVHHARDPPSPMVLISFAERNFNFGGCLFFSLDLQTGLARPIHSLNEPPFTSLSVVETLNGLICFELGATTYLCNLSTGEMASLPANPLDFAVNSSAFMPSPFSSLGFDPEKREYKIMKTWLVSLEGGPRSCHKIMKLGDSVWRDIDTGPLEFRLGGSVFLNGALHYLTEDSSSKKLIVAFDVALEKFSEMSLPDKAASSGNKSSLALLRGHLVLLESEHLEDEGVITVYELKDYQTRSWEEHRIELPPGWNEQTGEGFLDLHVTAISTDEILLTPKTVFGQFCVLLYDTKTNNLRRLEIVGLPEAQLFTPLIVDCDPIEYIESILSFVGPV